jgi:transglutaminase-like putative cysteine protease
VFLQANNRVPIEGRPLELLKDLQLAGDPRHRARQLYDRVGEHMKYKKQGTGWGHGDAVWACESGYGNCTDFHSLFISLARGSGLPAQFEIGFPLPPERGAGEIEGYHCWAYFYSDEGVWVPVDISEADKHPELHDYYFGNLTENRVAFSRGRDLELAPRQDGPPLNFFVYPYVEVDGEPLPADELSLRFRYEDL